MAEPKLKHCPFCGGAPTFVKHEVGMRGTRGFDSWSAVACRACCATIGAYDRRFRSKDDAAAAWNLRPATNGVRACVADSPAPADDWSVARDCAACGRMATPGGPCQRAYGVAPSLKGQG